MKALGSTERSGRVRHSMWAEYRSRAFAHDGCGDLRDARTSKYEVTTTLMKPNCQEEEEDQARAGRQASQWNGKCGEAARRKEEEEEEEEDQPQLVSGMGRCGEVLG